MKQYCFSLENSFLQNGLVSCLEEMYNQAMPVIVCVGTDGVVGDSLGPLVGSFLKEKNLPAFIYGELFNPITAKQIVGIKEFIYKTHPDSKVLVIDSAVGDQEEIGLIKICDQGIKPGLGAKKDLPKIGDISIIGIVEKRGKIEKLKSTRLRLVYKMAQEIALAIEKHIVFNIVKESKIKSLTKIGKLQKSTKKAN